MNPFSGYIINNDIPVEFTYYEGDALSRTVSDYGSLNPEDAFGLNIHDYENNGSMTVALYNYGERIDNDRFALAAFDGSACVGYAESLLFPIDGTVIFPLMVYGNEDGANLEFKAYDKVTGEFHGIMERMSFTADMRLGNGLDPVAMTMGSEQPNAFMVGTPYPNPFNPSVSFDVELSSESYVQAKVYNISGQEMATVHDGLLSGSHQLTWMSDGHASGVYFIKVMVDGQQAANRKIVLLK